MWIHAQCVLEGQAVWRTSTVCCTSDKLYRQTTELQSQLLVRVLLPRGCLLQQRLNIFLVLPGLNRCCCHVPPPQHAHCSAHPCVLVHTSPAGHTTGLTCVAAVLAPLQVVVQALNGMGMPHVRVCANPHIRVLRIQHGVWLVLAGFWTLS